MKSDSHIKPKPSATKSKALRSPNFNSAHAPKESHTLMRSAVRQPRASLKRRIKVNSSVKHIDAKSSLALVSSGQKMFDKSQRHLSVKKSDSISHFSIVHQQQPKIEKPSEETKPAPASKPVINNWPRTSADVLERAIEHAAGSIQEPPVALSFKKRRRLASGWLISIGFLVIAGIFVSQNMTSIRLQLAAAKAGFNASLPRDMPVGYSFSKLDYQSGVVSTSFHSNSNSYSYEITQRTTLWNNQSLKNDFVKDSGPNYVAINTSGLTIFLYGNHNATWISNGIWYDVESNGALSDNQLIQMADSSS